MERRTALQRSYQTLTSKGQTNARKLAKFFIHHGQGLLPMVDLIEQSRLAVDELIDVAGRATPGQRRTGLVSSSTSMEARNCAGSSTTITRSGRFSILTTIAQVWQTERE
jgi:hypothetical protein